MLARSNKLDKLPITLRIGIDALHLFGEYSGVQRSLAELVAALRRDYPADELVLYTPRDFKGVDSENSATNDAGLRVRKAFFPGRWRTVRTLWRNFRLQSLTYRDHCDLLHGPSYALPAALSKPAVVTIHDVIALTHPLFATPGSARIQSQVIPRSVQVARRVIAPSIACKEQILRNVKAAKPELIDVIPWGVGEEFKPLDPSLREEARVQLKLPEPYILFVGNLEPKKNIPALIKSFYAAKAHKKLPHKLVIAGKAGWGNLKLEQLIQELNAREHIFFTGYVPQRALPALYSLADAFVLPSFVEGFGMPVLEAMACGCPVVISPDEALREVAGSAAHVLKYDGEHPLQPLREAFEYLLLDDRGQLAELSRRGLERAKLFSWQRTAKLTHQTYERALE